MKILLAVLSALSMLLAGCAPVEIEEAPSFQSDNLTVVPTLVDNVSQDSAWCATFQLVWNDMKNEIVKQDVVFNPQLEMAENLNKETFKESMLSDEYYYKKFGLKTLELKAEIEQGILEKFNETSDILEDFDWSESGLYNPARPDVKRYFFYTMLRRDFTFPKVFTTLKNGTFANKYENVEYFGIDSSSDKSLDRQVSVLYYNSEDDFAITLHTENKDDVILCKSPKGKNFEEIYNNILKNSNEYTGSYSFNSVDELKIPKLKFNEKREYDELAEKTFYAADGDECVIAKAIQTIEFELDEKGGKIKSEAAIDMIKTTAFIPTDIPTPRYFYLDDTFAIFLKEESKDVPYFAARIDDITKFQ